MRVRVWFSTCAFVPNLDPSMFRTPYGEHSLGTGFSISPAHRLGTGLLRSIRLAGLDANLSPHLGSLRVRGYPKVIPSGWTGPCRTLIGFPTSQQRMVVTGRRDRSILAQKCWQTSARPREWPIRPTPNATIIPSPQPHALGITRGRASVVAAWGNGWTASGKKVDHNKKKKSRHATCSKFSYTSSTPSVGTRAPVTCSQRLGEA